MSSHCPKSVQGRWRGAGDVFQLFGHIFAQAAQVAAAVGAFRVGRGQFDLGAGNMVRDRFAPWLVCGCVIRQAQLGGHGGNGDCGRFQRQLQLFGRLGRCPEAMDAMACQLVPQLLDQHRLRLHFGQQNCGERPQFGRVIRQRFGDIQHGKS